MAKVHPKGLKNPSSETDGPEDASVLTVWKKSLMFNCNGFTVFDSKGDLVFRVDNYMNGHRGQILLMDATGKPLLTVRRKRLSFLGDYWVVCEGETALKPKLTVRKSFNVFKPKTLAYVTTGTKKTSYNIQGSYSRRCCVVYDGKQSKVGELTRKEGVGDDVFRLVVHSSFQSHIAMALVIVLDQMFGGS